MCLMVEGAPPADGKGGDGKRRRRRHLDHVPVAVPGADEAAAHISQRAGSGREARWINATSRTCCRLIVTVQQLNAVMSVKLALAYAEAARDVITENVDNPVQPIEPTLTARSKQVKDGKLPVSVRGRVVRIPTTDVDLAKMSEELRAEAENFRSREFFSGTGTSGEPALHLARIQAAELTKLEPAKRATTDKANARHRCRPGGG